MLKILPRTEDGQRRKRSETQMGRHTTGWLGGEAALPSWAILWMKQRIAAHLAMSFWAPMSSSPTVLSAAPQSTGSLPARDFLSATPSLPLRPASSGVGRRGAIAMPTECLLASVRSLGKWPSQLNVLLDVLVTMEFWTSLFSTCLIRCYWYCHEKTCSGRVCSYSVLISSCQIFQCSERRLIVVMLIRAKKVP